MRTWGEIIEDAKRRLSYFQDQLQHDPSFGEARDYLSRNHGSVIPEALLADHTNENQDNGANTANTAAVVDDEEPIVLQSGAESGRGAPSAEAETDSPDA